ncbi:MAG: hypothetical protein A2081_05460 [Elusimicrobia bacterium GWC2_61_19]|nr:MAG: hypothetical protein A2081_05460 [Elusimicrobia bacterium GWC2_61_19]
MRGAIIGLSGNAEKLLAPAFLTAGHEAACLCGDLLELEQAGRLFPRAAAYEDSETMFSKEGRLDFALVRCAPERRFKAALRALENRLHVICETPFCFSSSDLEELRGLASKNGLVLAALQPWERSSAWLALEKILNGGLLGKVRWAEVQLLLPGPAPAGGITAAAGWPAFSMLLGAVRLPPTALAARLTPSPEPGGAPGDSAAAFQVHFSGADGFVHLLSGSHAARTRLAAAGEKGRVDLDGGILRLDINGVPPETILMRDSLSDAADQPERLAGELRDFSLEIEKKLPPGSGLRNARYCVKLLKNAYYSVAVKSAAVPL